MALNAVADLLVRLAVLVVVEVEVTFLLVVVIVLVDVGRIITAEILDA